MRVTLLIRALTIGGAERQVQVLAKALADKGHCVTVLTFYPSVLDETLGDGGPEVICLGKSGRWQTFRFCMRLVRQVRRLQTDVVYSMLPVPNLLVTVLRPLMKPARIVCGVRASQMDVSKYPWLDRMVEWLHARMLRHADAVIFNSIAAQAQWPQARLPSRVAVVPNGIDVTYFRPSVDAADCGRRLLGLAPSTRVVGWIGRLDPMKDPETFLEAVAICGAATDGVKFVLVGSGSSDRLLAVRRQAKELGVEDKVVLLAGQRDPLPIYNALDVLVSSSAFGEGFSNVIAEAMACGVRVVATDVGDARRIVDSLGWIVPCRSPRELAKAIDSALAAPVEGRIAGRIRVENEFSPGRLAESTEEVLLGLSCGAGGLPDDATQRQSRT